MFLALLGRPSFAIVLFGPSKIGKSMTQLVAASALGFGREQDLPSLNATPAGLLSAAMGFNDHMLPINEVGTAREPKREVYVTLRDATYALMNGQDTIRHPSWTGGAGARTFQVICLLSSEISPDAWAARNGETRDDGEMARLIGVPVMLSTRRTIFDRHPRKLAGDALAAWEKAQCKRLWEGAPDHRGVAFQTFLDALLRDVESNRTRARSLSMRFERKVAKTSMSPVARDIVAKFGILYAGGVLAVEAGVLPLNKKAIGPAVRRACRAALAELPDPEGELKADLAKLKERLLSGSILNLVACTRQQMRMMRNADGVGRKLKAWNAWCGPRFSRPGSARRCEPGASWSGSTTRASSSTDATRLEAVRTSGRRSTSHGWIRRAFVRSVSTCPAASRISNFRADEELSRRDRPADARLEASAGPHARVR